MTLFKILKRFLRISKRSIRYTSTRHISKRRKSTFAFAHNIFKKKYNIRLWNNYIRQFSTTNSINGTNNGNSIDNDPQSLVLNDLKRASNQKRFYSVIGAILKSEYNILDYIPENDSVLPSEIAKKCKMNHQMVFRILRYISQYGYTFQNTNGTFKHTEKSLVLRGDNPIKDEFVVSTSPEYFAAYGNSELLLEKGPNTFLHVHGKNLLGFDSYLEDNPQRSNIWSKYFDRSEMISPIVNSYDFNQFETIADIGGALGQLLTEIIDTYPNVKNGILYELPEVCEYAKKNNKDISDKIKIIEGDWFVENDIKFKVHADCFILRWILHSWQDIQAKIILKNIRKAMNEGQTLIMFEIGLIDDKKLNTPQHALELDMHMAMATGGLERSLAEIDELLYETGFERVEKPLDIPMAQRIVARAV